MSVSQTRSRLLVSVFTFVLSLLLMPANALAQALVSGDATEAVATRTAAATTNDSGPAGIIPLAHGLNASLASTSQHDSSAGWSSLLTPNVAYRFNRFLSTDISIPIYGYINIDVNKGTKAKPVYHYETRHGALADTALAGHLDLYPSFFDYTITSTLGLPTGNTKFGLGAGQPTYDINNHLEKSLGIFTPDIELGIGDSSALIGSRVRKSYTAVGTLAHFQAGSSIDLPFNMDFEADAYEQLPIDPQTIYSTTGRGKKKVTVATGQTAAEDNGVTTSLDIPFNPHITLSGFYNRSILLHDDIAGFSLTFLLRAPPPPTQIVE